MADAKKTYSFTNFSATRSKDPQPGDELDNQFADHRASINETRQQLADVRRSDGALVNGIVTKDSLAPDLFLDVKTDVQNAVAADLAASQSYASLATTAGNLAAQSAVDADAAASSAQAAAAVLSTAQGSALATINQIQTQATLDLKRATDLETVLELDVQAAAAAADLSDKYAVLSSYWAEWLGADGRTDQTIPPNALKVMGITGDHWSARFWATRAANAFGHLFDLYLGIHATAPTANLSGGPLAVGSLYYNSTTNKPYIWTGTNWKPFFSSEKAHTSTLYYKAPAAATQSVFPLSVLDLFGNSFGYDPTDPEATEIHVNGVRLLPDDGSGTLGDYNINTATSTITFIKPLNANSIVTVDLLTPKNKLTPGSVNFHSTKDINLDPVTYAPGYQDGLRKVFTVFRTDGNPVAITDSEQLFVSVDGVVQQPGKDFTAAGATVTFTDPPATDSKVWMFWMEPGGSGASTGVVPPVITTIWQGLHYVPGTPGAVTWEDIRGIAETVQNTADLLTIPASHLNNGKLVFAQDTNILYTSLVNTATATGTMADWQAIVPHADMYLTTAYLPNPATASPPLQDGQLAIVSLDALLGKAINRPYFYDAATTKWLPLSQMQMSKALRSDADRVAFAKDDLQVTYEANHQELKFWDGTAWQTIYSFDAIKNLIASSSLFEGTAQEVGGTAVGAVQLNALPNLAALAAAVDLTKTGHYWVWQGSAKYAVTAATPSIGTDLNGVTLEPGDWLSVSNTGTTAAPVFKWTVIRGDLISKSRGDTLFGLSPYAAGSWEYGSTVVYQGSIYRATAGVLPTDPAPGAVGSPWGRVPLDNGFVTVASDVQLPATGSNVGQIYFIENSAAANNYPAFMMWNGTAWVNTAGEALTKTHWDAISTFQTWTNKVYEINTLVSYNGRYYRASAAIPLGTAAPGVSPLWTDITPSGSSGIPTWDAVTAYAAFVLVIRNGVLYYSTAANTNVDPALGGSTTKTLTPIRIGEMNCIDGTTGFTYNPFVETFDFSTAGVTPGEYYFIQMDDNAATGPTLGVLPYAITAGQFKGKQLLTETTYVVYTGNKLNGIYGWVLVNGGVLGSAAPGTFSYSDNTGNPWTQVSDLKIGDMLDVSKVIPAQQNDALVYNASASEWTPTAIYPKIAALDTINLVNNGAAWTNISNTWKNAVTLNFPIDSYISVGHLFRVELNFVATFVNPTVKASSCLVVGAVKVRGAGSQGWRDASIGTGVTKVISGERYMIGTVTAGMTIGVAIDLLSSATTDGSNTVKGNVVFYDLGPATSILAI